MQKAYYGSLVSHDAFGTQLKLVPYYRGGCVSLHAAAKLILKDLKLENEPEATKICFVLVTDNNMQLPLGEDGVDTLARYLSNTDSMPPHTLRGQCVELGPSVEQWVYLVVLSEKVRLLCDHDLNAVCCWWTALHPGPYLSIAGRSDLLPIPDSEGVLYGAGCSRFPPS